MALARDVGGHLHPVGEADAGDLTDGGGRLPGGLRSPLRADAALEGRGVVGRPVLKCVKAARKRDDLRLASLVAAALLRELVDSGHVFENPRARDESTIYKCV